VRHRRLAVALKGLREDAGLTQESVIRRVGINSTTLYRIENATNRPQLRTLNALLDLYETPPAQRDQLVALLHSTDTGAWRTPYQDGLPPDYSAYIGFEREATELRNFEALFVPGLLQTERYAWAVVRGVLPSATPEEVEHRVRARIERQRLLSTAEPPRLWAVMDEAALTRMVGGPEIMREQMTHLREMASHPSVTIQVIPFAAGAHPGMPGSFVLLTFPEVEGPEIIYSDSLAGDLFLDEPSAIRRYVSMFDTLCAVALSPDDSTKLFDEIGLDLTRGTEKDDG
jgi:transcriptional regulator with XRE-family HTH domain